MAMEAVGLAIAGILAGVAGTAGMIASLIAYPALLAAGILARTANVTTDDRPPRIPEV